MRHEVAPALARKFGEPGGLFDTVLQRLVSEWHRFQVDRDPHRLPALAAILEAGLSQLRSLELLLRTADEPEGRAPEFEPSQPSDQDVRPVYAATPRARPERRRRERGGGPQALSPARLGEAMRLLEALQEALQGALRSGDAAVSPARREPPRPAPQRDQAPETEEPSRVEPYVPDFSVEPREAFVPAEPIGAPSKSPADEGRPARDIGQARPGRPIDEVFQREAFDVASAAELKRCRRFERAFSLLLLNAGTVADESAGKILLSNLREFDLVGYYGDDVFAVGLPETSAEAARSIAQRLVGLLARRGAWSDRGRYGIATYPRDGNTLTTVVRSARAQLGARDIF